MFRAEASSIVHINWVASKFSVAMSATTSFTSKLSGTDTVKSSAFPGVSMVALSGTAATLMKTSPLWNSCGSPLSEHCMPSINSRLVDPSGTIITLAIEIAPVSMLMLKWRSGL